MTYSISSEEELARELASRGISPFTEVTRCDTSVSLFWGSLFLGTIFLVVHLIVFYSIYAVQFSRVIGNYAETEATVTDQSSRTVERKRHNHGHHSHPHSTSSMKETRYYVHAVSADGTEFNFSGSSNFGGEGTRLKVKYSKGNPRLAYVDGNLAEMLFDRFPGVIMLVFSVLAFWGARAEYRRIRKCKDVLARDLYLPVRESSRYEMKTVRTKKRTYNEYAPVYRYAMPDGADLFFQGRWSGTKPEGEPANDNKDFRVYLMDPEDPKNNRYFIREIPHQFEGLEGFV